MQAHTTQILTFYIAIIMWKWSWNLLLHSSTSKPLLIELSIYTLFTQIYTCVCKTSSLGIDPHQCKLLEYYFIPMLMPLFQKVISKEKKILIRKQLSWQAVIQSRTKFSLSIRKQHKSESTKLNSTWSKIPCRNSVIRVSFLNIWKQGLHLAFC